ncbi:MAG: hypothetical protein MJ157_01760, partial [Clostridia bacterium]|nr:hypothetical protein [Clostridia bacterium]
LEEEIEIVVQINGKVREKMLVPAGLDKESLLELVLADARTVKLVEGKQLLQKIAVPGKLVNLVVK